MVVTASPTGAVFGQTVAFTASISGAPPGAGLPLDGGTVVFYDGPVGSTIIGSATLTGGQATFSYSGLSVATHTISASFAGDANLLAGNGSLGNFVVSAANTTVTVAASPAGGVNFGNTATFTATVTGAFPGAGTPADGDSVVFKDGATTIGVGTLSGGVATFSTSGLSAGLHVITATFAGDANFGAGTGTLSPNYAVVLASTSTALAISPTSGDVAGQAVTLTDSVTSTTGGTPGTPGGSVTFWDGAVGTINLGTRPLVGGTATLITTALGVNLAPGHTINAVYSGSSSFAGSTGMFSGYQVAADGTTTTVATLQTSPVFGQPVQFTATVVANPPGGGSPSNGDLVTFQADGTSIGIGTLSNGTASFTYSGLSIGTHTITAIFAGDASFGGSTGTLANYTVAPANSVTTVSVAPSSGDVFGQLVTLSATISAAGVGTGTPANGDSVSFYDGAAVPANLLSTGTLTGGVANVTTSALTVGTHTITAVFAGDAKFAASTGTQSGYIVSKAGTLTALAPVSNVIFGQPAVFTATVTASSGSGIPTSGTVTFMDGSTVLGTATLSGTNIAAFTTGTPLSLGNHAITATYNGSANFNSSVASAPVIQGVGQASSAIALASSAPIIAAGSPVTFTATVTPVAPSTAAIVAGTVTFKDGATTLGSVTLSGSNIAMLTTSTLAQGVHQITASFTATANYTGSTSSLFTETVLKASTVTLTPSPSAPAFGQTTNLTVAVTGTGTPAPTGTVTVTDTFGGSTNPIASNVSFASPISLGALPAGTHTITVTYSGDSNFASSTKTLTLVVSPAVTTTTLAPVSTAVFGQPVTFTATVTAATGGNPTTGNVTFKDGATTLATVALSGFDFATYTTSTLAVASHTITAVYSGIPNDATSTSAARTQVISAVPTTTTVTSAVPSPSSFGQSVTFTATVVANGPSTALVTSGTVTFKDGTTTLGTGTVNASGMATFTTSALAVANHSITAVYAATANFAASTSAIFTQSVTQAGTATSLASSLPSGSVFGQAVTFRATVTNTTGGANPTTGTVIFQDGSTTIGTITLSGTNVAVLTTATLSVPGSPHAITATYQGTTNNVGSVSNVVSQTVTQASTVLVLTSSPSTWAISQPTTFTATLSSPSGGVPTGTASSVTFTITGPNGPVTLPATTFTAGKATLVYTFPATPGGYTVVASYAGSTNFTSSFFRDARAIERPQSQHHQAHQLRGQPRLRPGGDLYRHRHGHRRHADRGRQLLRRQHVPRQRHPGQRQGDLYHDHPEHWHTQDLRHLPWRHQLQPGFVDDAPVGRRDLQGHRSVGIRQAAARPSVRRGFCVLDLPLRAARAAGGEHGATLLIVAIVRVFTEVRLCQLSEPLRW